MKEKMLKEKGAAKAYIIVIVILVLLCIGIGVFAVINLNKDKEDEEETSKKNETNTVEVKNETEEEEDDDTSKTVKYIGELDMAEIMGTDELADTTWTLSIEGDDDSIKEMVITAELENYFKEAYTDEVEAVYTYDEFVEEIHNQMGTSMESVGTSLATSLGVSASDITTTSEWTDDEILEIRIDLSKVERDTYTGIDDSDSVIEKTVEELEDAGVTMKKSK